MMGMAAPAVGGMAARHQAASGGVALGVRSGARGTVVVRGMTVGAATMERGVGEGVLDAPAVFEPRSERLIVS
jgi:hypothetical protein